MARLSLPAAGVLLALLSAGCGGRTAPFLGLPFAADTVETRSLRRGVTHRYIHAATGPWAIHVLELELDRCVRALALKGAGGAAGRARTSALLRELGRSRRVIGGVNADFFLFAPPGVPAGAMIARGRVITGPSAQPVLAFDSAGTPRILILEAHGSATLAARRFEIAGWNRVAREGLTLFDAAWGVELDTASAAIEVVFRGGSTPEVTSVDTSAAGARVPPGGGVLFAPRGAPPALRAALLAVRAGDPVQVEVALAPFHPAEAVGGRPVLLRDSVIAGQVDTEGQPGFATGRHPRTAVGIARGGTRLIVVVVDGRQKPYSDGMTLRELAGVLLALGARDAINLDGGGSSTLVIAGSGNRDSLRVANRPSDATGERAVGNALGFVAECSP